MSRERAALLLVSAAAVAVGVWFGLERGGWFRHVGWWLTGVGLVAGVLLGVRALWALVAGLVAFMVAWLPQLNYDPHSSTGDNETGLAIVVPVLMFCYFAVPILVGALLRWLLAAARSTSPRASD